MQTESLNTFPVGGVLFCYRGIGELKEILKREDVSMYLPFCEIQHSEMLWAAGIFLIRTETALVSDPSSFSA